MNNPEEKFILAIKQLEETKTNVWKCVSATINVLSILLPDEYNTLKAREIFKYAFSNIDEKILYSQIEEIDKIRYTLGNEIYLLFKQYVNFLIRIYYKSNAGYKLNNMSDWRIDESLSEILDKNFHVLIYKKHDFNKINGSPIHIIIEEINKKITEKIEERLKEFKSKNEVTITGDRNIIGHENTVGENIKVKSDNKTTNKITIRQFAKENPLFFWIQIFVDVFAIFLTLIQLGWIKI